MSSKNEYIINEVNNLVHFDNLQVDVQNEMEIILTSYKCSSFSKGYHAHQNIWDLVKGEIIQAEMEPTNSVGKYAVAAIRGGYVVGHLKKRTSKKFAKTVFYFLECDESKRCWVEVTGKRCNLDDTEGIQVSCMLHVKGSLC